jgi:hypothetical protein
MLMWRQKKIVTQEPFHNIALCSKVGTLKTYILAVCVAKFTIINYNYGELICIHTSKNACNQPQIQAKHFFFLSKPTKYGSRLIS